MADSVTDRRDLLKNALDAIERLKERVRSFESDATDPIAIIGASCRFPGGVDSLDSYWALLRDGRDAVTEIPAERWRTLGLTDAEPGWHAGLVDRLDYFDPRFFGISAREATTMDPQQRLVLEVAWEALEHAGQAPDRLAGSRTGVFLGITGHDYADLLHDNGGLLDVYAATGNANNAAAGRLSFVLGLQGPSVAVDTACSSSLVAIHLACRALKSGDCRMAIAGGVNALLAPGPFVCFRSWGMMAPDGHCKTFDASANGFVRGEGCGLIVLKRLSHAQADGDRILAVIRGSAVNQDGRSSGLTVPNGPAQEAVIQQALAVGKIDPLDVGYVEAHGTGTSLGDPIEAHALAAVLGHGRQTNNPLVIGSVKTNIGHLESAAGVAGLLKVVLSLQHERIPAHLHFTTMNPDIDWNDVPVEIPVHGRDWPRTSHGRFAGVSSFGFSGTNAHVVLQEAPIVAPTSAAAPSSISAPISMTTAAPASVPADISTGHAHGPSGRPLHIFTWSARTEAARDQLAAHMSAHLAELSHPEHHPITHQAAGTLANICYTTNAGRAQLSDRAAVTAATVDELYQKLTQHQWMTGHAAPGGIRIASLFTGQGSQWPGMGRTLYDTEPVFRAALNTCAERLAKTLEHSLLDVLYGEHRDLLDQTAYTQPALFAIEWALAQLWKHWGIEPDVVLGHSIGEYVALCVAGVWTLDDGLQLIAERGRLMQALGAGWGMTAVQGTRTDVEQAIRGLSPWVSLAAINAPQSLVVSGRLAELAEAERRFASAGLPTKSLTVSHAFHSAQMDPMAETFAARVVQTPMHEPQARIVSSVTGQFVTIQELRDPDYWRRQVRQPVEFQTAMETLAHADYETFLECGPSTTLSGLGRQSIGTDGQLWAASLSKNRDAWQQMLDSLGQLYVRGATVDWQAFDAAGDRRFVTLPSYPFQRQRYWIQAAPRTQRPPATGHPFLGTRFVVAGPANTHVWETGVSIDTFPYLADHRVQGDAVVPATAYVEMGVAVGHELFGDVPITVSALQFQKPLFLTPTDVFHVQITCDASDGAFRVYSRTSDTLPWTLHVTGRVERGEHPTSDWHTHVQESPGTWQEMNGVDFYNFFHRMGNQWGPMFQGVQHARFASDTGVSAVTIPTTLQHETHRYYFHPAVADATGHILAAITTPTSAQHEGSGAFVGQGIERVTVYARPQGTLKAYARVTATSDPTLRSGDVRVVDETGQILSDLTGAQLRYLEVSATSATSAQSIEEWFYQPVWQEHPFTHDAIETRTSSRPNGQPWLIVSPHESTTALANALGNEMRADGVQATLLSALPSTHTQSYAGIISLWNAHIQPPEHPSLPDAPPCDTVVDTALANSQALLDLIHTLARDTPTTPLWIATTGVQAVCTNPHTAALTEAPLVGIGRTLAVEHPELYGGLIDLDPATDIATNARLLWKHLTAPQGEDQVAFRNGQRFAERLEPYTAPVSHPPTLHTDGTYVITGGLGGLGLAVAQWLADAGARRLILIARSTLPPRADWQTLPAEHPQAQAIRSIRAIEAAGASVHVQSLDIADAKAVHKFFTAYERDNWPAIRGVIHAAGVLHHHTLLELTHDQLAISLRPKLGAWNLHKALKHAPLDFFALFSSASALLSSPKLGAYAAANCFLDTLAHYRRGHRTPALSINWGVWGETGMAAQFDTNTIKTLADRGMGTMRTDQGLDALSRLLGDAQVQTAVLPVNWQRWAERYPSYTASPFLASVLRHTHTSQASVPHVNQRQLILSTPAAERPVTLAQYLAATLGTILGFAPGDIDQTQPISTFGLDSLTAVEFKNRIAADLGVSLPTVRLLQGPAIAELVAEIDPLIETATDPATGTATKQVTSSLNGNGTQTTDAALLQQVDQLSDTEVDAALAALLRSDPTQ